MINLKVNGARKILKQIKRVSENVENIEKEAVYLTANLIKNTAVKSIKKVSIGEVVRRSRQGKGTLLHVASKEGDAPNTDTGKLVKSISVQPLQPRRKMTVGANALYAADLEFGTKNNLEARPFMQPAMEEHKDALEKFLAEKLRALLAKPEAS
jgi:HK97 gp10 family phage protein